MVAKSQRKKSSSSAKRSPTKAALSKSKSKRNDKNDKRTIPASPVDQHLVAKAVAALLQYHQKSNTKNNNLLGDNASVQVQLSLLRAPPTSGTSPKPIRIPIPHSLYKVAESNTESDANSNTDELEEPDVCLIVKDESKPFLQDLIAKFPHHLQCVKKVLTLTSLRTKHKSYEQRRELLHKYTLFLADDRILPMLSKALGKDFYKHKKLPLPVNVTRHDALPFAIRNALSACTHMTRSKGTCWTIRAGTTAMSQKSLTENIESICQHAALKVPRKWANVQAISIKTPESMALPIYNQTPQVLEDMAQAAGYKPPPQVVLNNVLVKEDKDDKEEKEKVVAGQEETDAATKKKRKGKSPLVQALKKQKQQDDTTKQQEKTVSKKKAKRKADDDDDNKAAQTKQKKAVSAVESEDEQQSPAKKQKTSAKKKVEKKETKKTTPKKQPEKEQATSTTTASAKKNKSKSKEDDTTTTSTTTGGDFMAAKKFKGSKKGYVFKMGKQGLGYYVDVKPVVDRMAMEALKRSAKSQSRRGGQKKNKYKGTRRF